MKKIIVAALAASALVAAAAPALAQYGPPPPQPGYGPGPGPGPGPGGVPTGWDLNRKMDWIQARIERGRADGSLDGREAHRAMVQLASVRHEEREDRDRQGGHLSDGDRARMETQLDSLLGEIHWMHENNETRPW